jgi:hypothetical protein
MIKMAVPEARDSRGGDDQPCPRVVVTIPGGDEDLARAARSICRLVSDGSLTTDRQGNAALTMAPRDLVRLAGILAPEHQAEPDPDRDRYLDNQGRPYDPPSWHVSDYEQDPEPELDELLADPDVTAEAGRILAGEGGTILGIPFGPRSDSERGE